MAGSAPQSEGFSRQERDAMKTRAKELAAEKRASKKRADGEHAVRAAIDELSGTDKALAEKFHDIVTRTAPELWPKTWYGMPAYARDGKVICFFQAAGTFDSRYSTIGFNDVAHLDEGNMWATSFAIVELGDAEEARIVELVGKAAE
ncbi:MAG: iron chaperone [bacterium]